MNPASATPSSQPAVVQSATRAAWTSLSVGAAVLATKFAAWLLTGSFLGHLNFGAQLGLPLPRGFYLSTSFLFELAICLTVLGSASYLLDTLGHPGEEVR